MHEDMFHGFVNEVERWKIRWALVDDKPERLLHTLHATKRDLYTAIYSIISILVTMPVSSATCERSFSAIRLVKSYLRSTIGNEWLSNLSLMHVYTDMCKSTLISILMTFLAEGIGAFTFHKLIQVGGSDLPGASSLGSPINALPWNRWMPSQTPRRNVIYQYLYGHICFCKCKLFPFFPRFVIVTYYLSF